MMDSLQEGKVRSVLNASQFLIKVDGMILKGLTDFVNAFPMLYHYRKHEALSGVVEI